MIHEYEQTISSLIGGIATIVGALLALFGVILTLLAYQLWKMKGRMDVLEADFGASISLLNAVGVWLTNGAEADRLPHIPPNLIEYVTTWPTNAESYKENT